MIIPPAPLGILANPEKDGDTEAIRIPVMNLTPDEEMNVEEFKVDLSALESVRVSKKSWNSNSTPGKFPDICGPEDFQIAVELVNGE